VVDMGEELRMVVDMSESTLALVASACASVAAVVVKVRVSGLAIRLSEAPQ
jgi:hypothetical protein